eukprot:gnl/MRDRNA2_/MRDRNA2_75421_c0_seq1.p2 gnl/MRDRNA2_/MRDRNA2_75421_c0~~gnl/MRDRNA2_/MRDRNA2_75421_c0_seq1.p2  ORF type:complete len:184 (-),score=30.68 gnl/MRDRNA2_/MRDRNA2_75421_c0_seq1:712-1263(-)
MSAGRLCFSALVFAGLTVIMIGFYRLDFAFPDLTSAQNSMALLALLGITRGAASLPHSTSNKMSLPDIDDGKGDDDDDDEGKTSKTETSPPQKTQGLRSGGSSKTWIPDRSKTWIPDLLKRERRIFSQNGEDGVIRAIVEAMPTVNQYFVEFGVEDGSERNTRALQDRGWSGLMLDGAHQKRA